MIPAPCALPVAPAEFIGVQTWDGLAPDTLLFNLTADIPGHPRGSTVTAETLQAHGFSLPTIERIAA